MSELGASELGGLAADVEAYLRDVEDGRGDDQGRGGGAGALVWTRRVPTRPGWYWADYQGTVAIVEVRWGPHGGGELRVATPAGESQRPSDYAGARWAGPMELDPPREPIMNVRVAVTASDAPATAEHLRALAEMIETSPHAPSWSTSDMDGSTVAEVFDVEGGAEQ